MQALEKAGSSIPVDLPIDDQRQDRHGTGGGLRGHNGKPHAVQLQQDGQDEDADALEDQGAQGGDEGGDAAVAQCGEKGRGKDVEADRREYVR